MNRGKDKRTIFLRCIVIILSLAITITSVSATEILYDGPVPASDLKFSVDAYNSGTPYEISSTTPLGLLASVEGLTLSLSDKSYDSKGILLLDGIGPYLYDRDAGLSWICEVNGAILNDWENSDTDGLNVMTITPSDTVAFYFGTSPVSSETADAAILFSGLSGAETEGVPENITGDDWTLTLSGATEETVDSAYFTEAQACHSSNHLTEWTDENGDVWSGIPLWVLVGMVDDEESTGHYTFNDDLALAGYSIKVIASDGWDTSLESEAVARSPDYIIADQLNGKPLPALTDNDKPLWPLALKGPAIFGGQNVGSISAIELAGLSGDRSWTIPLSGIVTDTLTQADMTRAEENGHQASITDADGMIWTGVPLWYVTGLVDDLESGTHPTYNDQESLTGYQVIITGADENSVTLQSTDIAHNDGYILASTRDGKPLSGPDAPVSLIVDQTVPGSEIRSIRSISLSGLPEEEAGNWSLLMSGIIGATITEPFFEESAKCHPASWTDEEGNEYTGIPLWRLLGWVDDRTPHGSEGYNETASESGYTVIVKAGDGYAKEFSGTGIGTADDDYIVASAINGEQLSVEGDHPPYPLKLVGKKVAGGNSVGNIVEIELTEFGSTGAPAASGSAPVVQETPETIEIPKLHVVKYDTDGITILEEEWVGYDQMKETFSVIGDGTERFRYEGITNNPDDVWDEAETFPGGFKINASVQGTLLNDIATLVGGMNPGASMTLVASDGYETRLAYDSVYPNPAALEMAGEPFLAWNKDGKYVPAYREGYQLFFTGGKDGIFSLWDMHETMDPNHWHYYWGDGGVQYASAAGLAAKYITEVRIDTRVEDDWELILDGTGIGGLKSSISSGYFASALVCQFGSDHAATYTDAGGVTYEGMPIWFLCGFVDDEDQHSDNAYNQDRADEGYMIVVHGEDGKTVSIESSETIDNSGYLIASIRDGVTFAEDDPAWPLLLTGDAVTDPLGKISMIELKPLE